jgi:hypothetical protein
MAFFFRGVEIIRAALRIQNMAVVVDGILCVCVEQTFRINNLFVVDVASRKANYR